MKDEHFVAMASSLRRAVLLVLLDRGPREQLPVLDEIVVGDRDRENVRIELHHTHLPKLDELDFVEWNRDRHTVERGPRFEEIRPLVSVVDEH